MSIYGEIDKKNIDWEIVENEIIALGDSINDKFDDDTYLSDLIYGQIGKGDVITKVTELFLKHGYDVKANDGFNGAMCLHNLNWAVYDQYVLNIAELLLDAGTDTKVKYDESDEGGVLDSIDWRLTSWMEGDFDIANIYEAYFEMVLAYEEGRPYKGIRAFRECVGRTVQKVEKISFSKDSVLYDVSNKDAFTDALIIWADGIPLVASVYIDFMVNPYVPAKAVNCMDVSDEVKDIIGAKITGLRFRTPQNASISFDNGYRLTFSGDMGWGYENARGVHFIVDKSLEKCPISSGMIVDEIVLRNGRHWSESATKYDEDTVVLVVGDSAYQIYSKGKYGGNHYLKMNSIPSGWLGPSRRKIVAGKLTVDSIVLNEHNQPVRIRLIDGNEKIYITVDKYRKQVIYARTRINEAGEEVYVPMQFEDNSEWGKQEFPVQVKQ